MGYSTDGQTSRNFSLHALYMSHSDERHPEPGHDVSMTDFPIRPPKQTPLRGDEQFDGIDATVLDFWRFAMSNLKMNNVRGYLAEFLVARAVGTLDERVEWDSFDVLTPDGTTIEVKTSAYVQAWEQRTVSRISFSGLKKRTWSAATSYSAEQTYNADLYVFAVHTATTHEEYDELSTAQWKFYVVPRHSLQVIGTASISLPALERIAGPAIDYADLAEEIRSASVQTTADEG